MNDKMGAFVVLKENKSPWEVIEPSAVGELEEKQYKCYLIYELSCATHCMLHLTS